MGSRLDDECSVTQFPQGDYRYVKWWYGRPVSRSEQRKSEKSGKTLTVAKRCRSHFFPFTCIWGQPVWLYNIFLTVQTSSAPGSPNMGYTWSQILLMEWLNKLMITYLTGAMFWLKWTSKRCYVSRQGKNIFITPLHNWIHNCIWEWKQKWDPSLMTSTVWPVWPPRRPGIAHAWDGVGVGQVQGVLSRE